MKQQKTCIALLICIALLRNSTWTKHVPGMQQLPRGPQHVWQVELMTSWLVEE